MEGTPLDVLIGAVLPILAMWLGRYAYEGVQILARFVDMKLPEIVHAIALVVIDWLLLNLGQFLGMELLGGLDGLTPEVLTAIALTLGQMGWHKLSKKPPA